MPVQTPTSLLERLGEIVSDVDSRVKRVPWSNSEIELKFAKRGAIKIFGEGNTGFMGPCLDLSLVTYEMLRSRGINPTFVVRELVQEGYPIPRMHFALEFQHEGENYFLDFCSMNRVILRPGEFMNLREGTNGLGLARIKSRINSSKSLFDNVITGDIQDSEACRMLTTYYKQHLAAQISKLRHDNTPETYTGYLQKLGEKPGLYLDWAA